MRIVVDELVPLGDVLHLFDEDIDLADGADALVVEGEDVMEIGLDGHDAGIGEAAADVEEVAGRGAFGKEVLGDLTQEHGAARASLTREDLDELVADIADDGLEIVSAKGARGMILSRPIVVFR